MKEQSCNQSRYIRQIACVDGFEQTALSGAVVLIVGVGGLGSHVATSLTLAGVGCLILCDYDCIELSNLNRQPLYREGDIGKKKVLVAKERLSQINPEPTIIALETPFEEYAFASPLRPDLIIDCLDNIHGRRELISYARRHKIPLVHGAVEGFQGQVSLYLPEESACPFCAIDSGSITNDRDGEGNIDSAAPPQSLGACVSLIASLQATEAIKALTGVGEGLVNRILLYDGLVGSFDTFELEVNDECVACSARKEGV